MATFHATFPSLYTHFCRLLDLSQKLNMTFQVLQNTQSGHNSAEKYSNVAYFENYPRFSVSIEISAKCRYFRVL